MAEGRGPGPRREPDGHPGIRRAAAARTDCGTVVRDAAGDLAARKRAARVAPLPARRPAAAGAARTEPALQFGDALGLGRARRAELGHGRVTTRQFLLKGGDPASRDIQIHGVRHGLH